MSPLARPWAGACWTAATSSCRASTASLFWRSRPSTGGCRSRPFAPWLHRIVTNRALDWARAHALRRPVEARSEAIAPEARSDLSDDLAEAIGRLAPDQRAVIVLRYLLEHTPGEIAQMLDLPRGTVNSRLRRALDELAGEVSA